MGWERRELTGVDVDHGGVGVVAAEGLEGVEGVAAADVPLVVLAELDDDVAHGGLHPHRQRVVPRLRVRLPHQVRSLGKVTALIFKDIR